MKKIFSVVDKLKRALNKMRLRACIVECGNDIKCLGNVHIINCNVKLGNGVILYPGVSFEGDGKIEIGNNVKIGTNTIISASKNGGVVIGNDTIIAANCYIIDSNHCIKKGIKISEQPLVSKKLCIGDDVWIGTNASIIMNSHIKNGAVIGANSLVNDVIEKEAVAVGTPAKVKKYRE